MAFCAALSSGSSGDQARSSGSSGDQDRRQSRSRRDQGSSRPLECETETSKVSLDLTEACARLLVHIMPVLMPVLGGWVRETCLALTSDTRLALAELLREVDIVESTRRGRLVMTVETRSTHEATMWLQLIRGNAIVRAIRNREGVSCKMTICHWECWSCRRSVQKRGVEKLWFQPAEIADTCKKCV